MVNFRAPEVEEFRTNLYEAKTPLLGKGGVAAPSRKMARRHLVWRGRGGSSKLPLESIRRLNEPPRLRPAKVASRHFIQVHNEIPILVKREQFIIHGIH